MVNHDDKTVYDGLPEPFEAGRYHSLIAAPARVPDVLEISAQTDRGEIMGVRHRALCGHFHKRLATYPCDKRIGTAAIR